ncbi:MAG: sigma factor [Pseudomonadota bacterium]
MSQPPQTHENDDEAVRRGAPQLRVVASNEESDARLVLAARDGDKDAFRRLVDRQLGRAVTTAERLLGRNTSAEDIAQEAFVRLWQRLGELEVGAAGVCPHGAPSAA